jgi:hypothetical protein
MPFTKDEIRSILITVFQFLKHPLREIKILPDWDWKTLLFVQVIVSLVSGILSGLISLNFFALLAGLFVVPITSVVTAIVSSLFFYYTFLLIDKRQLPAQKLVTLMVLSNIPFFIFQTINPIFPFVTVIGFLFTALILVQGLTSNFNLNHKHVLRIVGTLFVIYLILWGWGRFDAYLLEKNSF